MGYTSSVSLEDDSRKFGLTIRSYFTDGTNVTSFIPFNEATGEIWQKTELLTYVTGPDGTNVSFPYNSKNQLTRHDSNTLEKHIAIVMMIRSGKIC